MRKIFISTILLFVSINSFALEFTAECNGFEGVEFESATRKFQEFSLKDETTYEFKYDSDMEGSLKLVVTGAGIIEPKKSERWHDLKILEQTNRRVSALATIGTGFIIYTLYPQLDFLHIAWVDHPNRRYGEGNSRLVRVSCKFKDSGNT
ncbi:MAG: hypothetical protein OIF38_02380 [Cellvibrionaceae bacterium]|nr:hypothetical protein [Cellvibrionaceae bacterium]